ncbi:MAG TPA: peptide chain release factor N(5)-glutamine methyltransferase [Bacteroidia bacterium]|nr:peptide chain release factor N(5)-glutamine methyltransferase [Bacteroidia bacterium]
MKISEIISLFRDELQGIYPAGEIEAFIFFTLNEYLGFSRKEIKINADQLIKTEKIERFEDVVNQLKNHKPIQYIIGSTEFYGLKLKVNEHVLIPRPETEELVDIIIKDHRLASITNHTILDIGTGSGCIAIALKKNIPATTVSAIDISEYALKVAMQNAEDNNIHIHFLQHDILKQFPHPGIKYNIIVSNPPYICYSEKRTMNKNVLDHEPNIALFVPDENALLFYKAITNFALNHLEHGGKLYFEINEKYGDGVTDLLIKKGFNNVILKKDMSGKDRMVIANKP